MWVIGHEDRVQVIQSVYLSEEAEQILSATFFKELQDTRALPGYQSAPSVSVNHELPPELVGQDHWPGMNYVSFGTNYSNSNTDSLVPEELRTSKASQGSRQNGAL